MRLEGKKIILKNNFKIEKNEIEFYFYFLFFTLAKGLRVILEVETIR